MEAENIRTKEDIFATICKASRAETLGLFIGSGFNKALLQDKRQDGSYDWRGMLSEVCGRIGVDAEILDRGMPYPQAATAICEEYALENDVTYRDAERMLKYIIADIVDVSPSTEMISKYEKFFEVLSPNWIVTTNYDQIIEKILHEKAFPINPRDSYFKTKDFIPVYHIHGSRSDPESIVITNEDYTHTLRTSDYRHARLPFLIKESTVLMIGYSLNDLNVLSAVDYCQNVYTNVSLAYEMPIIQLLYRENANSAVPYRDSNDIIIEEIGSLDDFLSELAKFAEKYKGNIDIQKQQVNELIAKFSGADEEFFERFTDDEEERLAIIRQVRDIDYEFRYIYSSYISFLNNVIGKLRNKAREPNAFDVYDQILNIILDLAENTQYSAAPVGYIDFLAAKFKSIAFFIGREKGKSWDALRTWKRRMDKIPGEFKREMRKRCKNDANSIAVERLLDMISVPEQLGV